MELVRADSKAYDSELALIPDDLRAFIQATQPKVWAKQQQLRQRRSQITVTAPKPVPARRR